MTVDDRTFTWPVCRLRSGLVLSYYYWHKALVESKPSLAASARRLTVETVPLADAELWSTPALQIPGSKPLLAQAAQPLAAILDLNSELFAFAGHCFAFSVCAD